MIASDTRYLPNASRWINDMELRKEIEMISRPCPVCGSTDESNVFAEANVNLEQLDEFAFSSRRIPIHMYFRYLSCSVCDSLYASPIPKLDVFSKAYEEAAFDSSSEAHYASRTYGSFLPEIVKNLPDLIGAIDIGTGDGAFLEQLLSIGFTDVVGVEPSKAPIDSAKPEIRPLIRQGIFRSEDFEDGRFSLITCFQTLEHLYEPMQMCRDAYRMLKEGGAAFFICHNRRSISARLLGLKSPIFDIEHLQLFSPESARYMLQDCGFVDIETCIIYNRYPIHYWIKLFPLPLKLKRALISLLRATGIGYLPISVPAGNLAVIGYKKKVRSS